MHTVTQSTCPACSHANGPFGSYRNDVVTLAVETDRDMTEVLGVTVTEFCGCDDGEPGIATDHAALLDKVREKNAGSFDGAPFYSLDGAWENAARDPHRLDMARRDGFGRRM